MTYALFLDQIDPSEVERVGPKAATLARLLRHELPVPDGFVVPADLWDLVAEQAHLEPLLARAATSGDLQDNLAKDLTEAVAAALGRAKVPIAALDALHRAFDRIVRETGAVVVRSSAVGEDRPEASSAGQYQTILNVREFSGLLGALRSCWLSLFRPSALRYRQRQGTGVAVPRMAVLVQAQIPCEVSGTLFTADPISGEPKVVIEATWGLGEAIAQGEVIPDRFVLDPSTLAELPGSRIGNKRAQRVLDPQNGTRLAAVPDWRRRRPTLDRSERAALALLGLRVSEILGAPQDIEWGRAAGRWWIFQSRPITTGGARSQEPGARGRGAVVGGRGAAALGDTARREVEVEARAAGESRVAGPAQAAALEPEHPPSNSPLTTHHSPPNAPHPAPSPSRSVWTSGFLDERLVEPVSPLGWSVLRVGLEEIAFAEPLRLLGVDTNRLRPLTRLWNGHPYANVAIYAALYKLFPDWLLPEDARRFFPNGDVSLRKKAPRPTGRLDPRVWVGLMRAFLGYPLVVSPFHNDRAWDRFEPRYVAAMSGLAARADTLSTRPHPPLREVLDLLDEVDRWDRELLRMHRWSLTFAEMWYSLLRRLAAGLVGSRRAVEIASGAVSRLNDQSIRMNQALAELRRMLAAGEDLTEPLRTFLNEYGHRSFSLDIMRPSFAADAAQVLALIEPPAGELAPTSSSRAATTSLRGATGGRRPHSGALPEGEGTGAPSRGGWESPERQPGGGGGGERASTDVAGEGVVGGGLGPVARLARRYGRLREDERFAWQRGLALTRRLYLLAGRVLVETGALDHPEGVFFLTADEVRQAVGPNSPDFRERVATRARELAAQQEAFFRLGRDSYPPFLRGDEPLPVETREVARPLGGRALQPPTMVLRGEPVSPGLGRGLARVVRTADDLRAVRPGEVLVVRGADPGWTVVFDRLAGLVAESGGQLSHAAVVAREYQLPAVVAVPDATVRIVTGDEVEVDGRDGTVRVVAQQLHQEQIGEGTDR